MKKFLLTFLYLAIFVIPSYSQVVVNEIMYAPTDATNEWFELYNTGAGEVNIQNWKWRDLQSTTLRTITVQSISIPAEGFIIVCQDSVKFKNQYPGIQGLYLQPNGWNALNNTGNDGVTLYDASNLLVDSVIYSSTWGGQGGFSLERKNPFGPSNDQNNWGTCIAPERATPNLPNSLLPRQFDLWLKTFTISPQEPKVGNTLNLDFVVDNIGTNAATDFSLNIYYDENRNGIPDPGELINTQSYPFLNPGDTLTKNLQIQDIDSGFKQYIGVVDFPADQDTSTNKLIRFVNVGGPPVTVSDVVVNEIMYTPTDATNEWFEIYNRGAQPVNVNNWKWRDLGTTTLRVITISDIFIQPGGYLVVCQDSVKFRARFPNVAGTILQSSGWSALNNTGDDGVTLYNASGSKVDSVIYNSIWGGQGAISLERKLADAPSNDQNNWGSSIAIDKATPNRVNSITPKDFDIALTAFSIEPLFPASGETVRFDFVIKNPGLNAAQNFSLNIYNDVNFDSIPDPGELINSNSFTNLNTGDSLLYSYSIPDIDSGYKQYIALLVYPPDEDTSNNKIVKNINVGGDAGGNFVINEIMFDPLVGQSEWIELYNATGQSINIRNYRFVESSNIFRFSPGEDYFINPGDFIVVAQDTSIFQRYSQLRNLEPNQHLFFMSSMSLSNSGEVLTFTDSLGNILDQVDYTPNWKNPNIPDPKGISLERINPRLGSNDAMNWSSCADQLGGTPGRQNSIFTPDLPSTGTVTISPNPFSPDGDGHEDFTIIKYKLTVPFAQMRVKVFDIKGRLVRSLANNQVTANEGTIIFDGLSDNGEKLRIGIYILYIEAIDDRGGQVDVIKAPVVVAAKL
jgi:hypothetical protein